MLCPSALQGRDIYIFGILFLRREISNLRGIPDVNHVIVIDWKESRVAHIQTPEGVDLLVCELGLKILNVLSMDKLTNNE